MRFAKVAHDTTGVALAKACALCDTSPWLQYVVASGRGNLPS